MCSKCVFRYLYFSYCSSAALCSCSSQNSLCLAPPIHLLPRGTVHTLRPATLVETNNKQTHAWHGGCGHCFQQCFQSIPFKSVGRNMITSVLTTKSKWNKSQRKLANRYVYIALHSLHTVRHDNIHITIRIVN